MDTSSSPRRAMWRRRRLFGPFYRGLLFLAGTTLWTCQVYWKLPDESSNIRRMDDSWIGDNFETLMIQYVLLYFLTQPQLVCWQDTDDNS